MDKSNCQHQGSFDYWNHRHEFVAIDEQRTEIHDIVTAQPKGGFKGKLVGMGMWLNLPILFAYRGWKTRRMLEK